MYFDFVDLFRRKSQASSTSQDSTLDFSTQSTQSNQQQQVTSDADNAAECELIEPRKKKAKLGQEQDKASRLARVIAKVIQDANAVLAMTDFKGRVDASHVKASYLEASENLSVSVKCLLCNPVKDCKLLATKYTATITNFKGHISRQHLQKDQELKEPGGAKVKMSNQSSIESFYKPKSQQIDDAAKTQLVSVSPPDAAVTTDVDGSSN